MYNIQITKEKKVTVNQKESVLKMKQQKKYPLKHLSR